ncbi:MAG: DVU0150 family protein [Desulfovibrionaceae bacterium]
MKIKIMRLWSMVAAAIMLLPSLALAAGGKAADLVVVADTRRIDSELMRYFADVYNTNPWLMAVWAVVLTAAFGCILGFTMDFLMERTGLDLKSRKIVEH